MPPGGYGCPCSTPGASLRAEPRSCPGRGGGADRRGGVAVSVLTENGKEGPAVTLWAQGASAGGRAACGGER